LTGFPLPDPNPTPPLLEQWAFALLFIGAMVFIFWWILTMLPEQLQAYHQWKRTRKEKRT
jgi:hypothetical protein